MKKIFALFFLVVLCLSAGTTKTELPEVVPGSLIVKLNTKTFASFVGQDGRRHSQGLADLFPGATVRWLHESADTDDEFGFARIVCVRYPAGAEYRRLAESSKALTRAKAAFVNIAEVVELNRVVTRLETTTEPARPNDPSLGNQWGLESIGAFEFWQIIARHQSAQAINAARRTVPVFVMDSGINADHPDMVGIVDRGASKTLYGDESPLSDGPASGYPFGHGTMVAGVIGARTNNNVGVAGLSSSPLVSLKIFTRFSNKDTNQVFLTTTYEDILKGYYEVLRQARLGGHNWQAVVNNSFAYTEALYLMREAISALQDKVLVVVSAGNTGDNIQQFPCGFTRQLPNVICVGSLSDTGGLSMVSTRGQFVDILAPGDNILSTAGIGGYHYATGTSLAAPFVAGVAAETMREFALTPHQTKRAILEGAQPNSRIKEIAAPIQLNAPGAWYAAERIAAGGSVDQPVVTSIVSAWSGTPQFKNGIQTIARGDVVTITGINLAVYEEAHKSLPLPTRLGGVSVLLNNQPIPLYYVGFGQINLHLPQDMFRFWPVYNVLTVVRYNDQGGIESWAMSPTFSAAEAEPAVLLRHDGYPVLVTADGTVVSSDRPAVAGETLRLYATGLGVTTPSINAGTAGAGTEEPNTVPKLLFLNAPGVLDGEIIRIAPSASYPGVFEIDFKAPDLPGAYAAVAELSSGNVRHEFSFNLTTRTREE